MPLCSFFAEFARPLLVGYLNGSKRRLEPVDKKNLDIAFIDNGVELVEEFDEQVICKIIRGSENVYPGAVIFWVRIEYHAF